MEVDNNLKRVLCINMLHDNKCHYGHKCLYAHSLNDQKVDILRQKAYSIIKNNDDLGYINLMTDDKLYKTLLELTKLCVMCSKNLCPGGYNCRNGAINIKYKVCYEDLIFGNCKKNGCNAVHLTSRGLVPYTKQKNIRFTQERIQKRKKYKPLTKLNDVKGVLLTDHFLISHFGKPTSKESTSSDSEDDETVQKIITYLNSDFSNSDEESIFED